MRIRLFDFLNAFPYQKVLQEAGLAYELYPDPKSVLCAWQKDHAGIALIPLAAVPRHKRAWLMEWGIASQGAVKSVLLLSEYPPNQWRYIACDTRSLSSVALLRLSMQRGLLPALPLVSSEEGKGAHLVIGDEALRWRTRYLYCIDLGEIAWKLIPLSMPFAVWCSSPKLHHYLNRILQGWRRIPLSWSEEAANRYAFPLSVVQEYWANLRYSFSHRAKVYWHRLLTYEVPQ
ncbi:MAG: hypothetical protein NZ580_07220 [Bacteroidia bacterium]|nr:hypothetical protein [Bacteroidia bacterium]MDW8236453.1 MqnA/MqnD/SBP family protein [Bacteroidia bacterium]